MELRNPFVPNCRATAGTEPTTPDNPSARRQAHHCRAVGSRPRYGGRPWLAPDDLGRLFQLESLVMPVVVDRRSPDLVRRLMFGAAEAKRSAEAEIEIARILQNVDQLFGIELRAGPFQGLDQDVGGDIAF